MEDKNEIGRLTLAIDCAVGSGSVAVLSRESVLASSSEVEGSPARAEEVLQVIESVLSSAHVLIHDLDMIAVSIGPGSYSGIRIGLATALGLAGALSVDCLGVPVLDALSLAAISDGKFITAVAVGKRHIGWSAFEVIANSGRKQLSMHVMQSDENFGQSLGSFGRATLLCDPSLAARIRDVAPKDCVLFEIHPSVAELVGVFANRHPGNTSLTPIYLRDDAGLVGQPVS